MPFAGFRSARASALLLLLSAAVPASAGNYALKLGQRLAPLQRLDCCNKDSIYLEMDRNGGIWIWKYGKREVALVNSAQIRRNPRQDQDSYRLELTPQGHLVATREYDEDGTAGKMDYWRINNPDAPKGPIHSQSYVQLTADKPSPRVRLELVVTGGASPKVTPLTGWK